VAEDRPRLEIRSRAEWREWLAEHHEASGGVWLITYKKGRGPYVPYDDVVEEALCFGWVDSKGLGVDADRSGLLMTPRKPKSGWSRPNKRRIEKLTAAGLMAPAGLAAVALALFIAAGRWSPALGWLGALKGVPAAVRADPAGAAYLIATAVFAGVVTWQLIPLVIPALGCVALAIVAVPERPRRARGAGE
jgi:hypothetical protein